MVKKFLFLLTFLFIFNINVNAQVLGTPLTSVDYVDNTSQQANASIGTWWDTQYYVAPFRIGYFTSATAEANKIAFYWGGANLCNGQNLKISGQIGALTNFFSDNSYSFNFLNNNQSMTCAIEYQEPSRIGFTCVGPGGGDLYIALNQHSFTSRENYEVAIRRDFDLSCEVTNLQVMQQDIINTQNIINSQNSNTQNIINNQNTNTNTITQNQNSNTQNIIDNQNQNTQDVINNQNETFGNYCYTNLFDKDNYSSFNKTYIDTSTPYWRYSSGQNPITIRFPVEPSTSYQIILNTNVPLFRIASLSSDDVPSSSVNRVSISNISTLDNQTNLSYNYTTSSNAKYIVIQFSNSIFNDNSISNLLIYKGNRNVPFVSFGQENCINKLDEQIGAINDLNDTLKNDSPPDTENQLNDLESDLISDTPITDLITLPITLINAYISGFNGSCSPFNLGNLYGTDIIFPCLNLQQKLGSNLWSTIDGLFSIFMIYNIAMLMIQAFEGFTSLRDDYESLYVPRHADLGYQPKHGGGN